MKNPNGYGTVFKLKGNRRRPFVARKTKGYNEKGHPQYITIGYFAKRQDALKALANFNFNPKLADFTDLTFMELYEKWKEKEWNNLSTSSKYRTNNTLRYIEPLFDMKFRDIKTYHIQNVVDQCPCRFQTKQYIKIIFSKLEELAMQLEIIDHKCSSLVKVKTQETKERHIFTLDEREKLWENIDMPYVDCILILIYSGWRISEFLNLKKTDIDLEEGIMRGGVKTEAGKNRIVPIHPLVFELLKKKMEEKEDCFLNMSTTNFGYHFKKVMENLGMDHIVHETRHTFRSMLDSAGGNKICIDLIMGHSIQGGTGEKVYTHKTVEELKETVMLITR